MFNVSHIDTSDEVTLYNADEAELSIRGDLKVVPTPGSGTADSILSDFKAAESGTITGVAPANRLSNQSEFSDDRLTAMYEYAQKLLTLVAVNQGAGWTISGGPRSKSIDVVFNKARWQKNAGDKYNLIYSVEFDRGEGIGDPNIPSPKSVSPVSSATLDGVDLGPLESWSQSVTQETKVYELTLEDLANNSIVTKSGPVRRVEITGNATDTRDTVLDKIEGLKGQDVTVPYQSPTGETFDVAVDEFDDKRDSAREEVSDYNLTLIEGST